MPQAPVKHSALTAKAAPHHRQTIVFWIALIVFGAIVASTTLLANNQRNLRNIAAHYHLGWLDGWLSTEERVVKLKAAPMETAPKGPRLSVTRKVPASHLFDAPTPALQASFVRSWIITGQQLCATLDASQIPVGPWRPSGFDPDLYECSYENEAGKDGNEASFFIIARGTKAGVLSGVRLKIILPNTAAGRDFRQKLNDVAALLVRDSRWGDLQGAIDSIGRLENVTLAGFGARLSFSHEFADPNRFNLMLFLERSTREQRRTADYFDQSKWLR